jgi:hypothetical protein
MIADTHHSLTQDWTGLTSGHQRPAKVQAAYDAMIEAWSEHSGICDAFADGKATHEMVNNALDVARYYDAEYHRIYGVWQTAQGECKCRPIDADREYVCLAHRAQAELNGDGEMPF